MAPDQHPSQPARPPWPGRVPGRVPGQGPGRAAWSVRANHTQGSRAVGGRLHLTPVALAFEPHALEAATGGLRWSVPVGAIAEVGEAPRTWHPFDGGLRRRLRVTLRDCHTALFVVPRLAQVVSALRAAARLGP